MNIVGAALGTLTAIYVTLLLDEAIRALLNAYHYKVKYAAGECLPKCEMQLKHDNSLVI